MKIRVLKGTDEIGGSCIEISTANTTILLDYGTPLSSDSQKISIYTKIDAILISHPHQDHFGEIVSIDTQMPIYCGELSLELMNATKIFTGNEKLTNTFHHFKAWQKFSIGDFTITPYLVDHSATDAYAFLIECENQKILYSGDFRANGRKAKLFYKMIEDKNLKNIDLLLMEGTMMQRSNLDFPDEQSVENKINEVLNSNENLSFMIGSSQNIDSIVSAYRASKKANKIFVVDIYTAWILEVVSKKANVPNISWDDVKVIKNFGGSYYEKIKNDKEHFGDFVNKVFDDVVSLEELQANPSDYLLKITPWVIEPLLEKTNQQNANIIYSQWLGYMSEEFSDIKTVQLFKNLQNKYNWQYAHTSGHADLDALKTFAKKLNPKKLVPIHTEHKEEFAKHFENVLILADNEAYEVGQSLSEYQVNELNLIFKDELEEN
jgi:ribonuclease J